MSEPYSILIIDDEENLRLSLALILEREGYVVMTAANAQEARQCLLANTFDLAFLDLKLPDIYGLTLLTELRRQYPHMQVMILTAQDKLNVALDAVRSGACDYLLKPVDPSFLIEHTRKILNNTRLYPPG